MFCPEKPLLQLVILLDFIDENLLEKEDLGSGTNTWASLAALEEEYDTAPFFIAVTKFYSATITTMIHLEILFFKTWAYFYLIR